MKRSPITRHVIDPVLDAAVSVVQLGHRVSGLFGTGKPAEPPGMPAVSSREQRLARYRAEQARAHLNPPLEIVGIDAIHMTAPLVRPFTIATTRHAELTNGGGTSHAK